MADPIKRFGPIYLTGSAANLYTPPASTFGIRIRRMHFCNTDTVARLATTYVGTTGGSTAGTEIFKDKSIPAKDTYDYVCAMDMASTDFLTGLADSASKITVVIEYEQYVKN